MFSSSSGGNSHDSAKDAAEVSTSLGLNIEEHSYAEEGGHLACTCARARTHDIHMYIHININVKK